MPQPTAPQPTVAQRIRSLLAAETSLDVVAARRRTPLTDRHGFDCDGRLRLAVPADCALALDLADGALPAMIEITDVSAVAMRDRVRARVTLTGTLRPVNRHGDDVVALLALSSAQLVERGRSSVAAAEELATAAPDVLATREAALLCHLVDTHADLVGWLARLVPREALDGARRIHPLRLDRYGIVLRLECPDADRDVRLPFTSPVETAADAPGRMLELLARARACRRHAA